MSKRNSLSKIVLTLCAITILTTFLSSCALKTGTSGTPINKEERAEKLIRSYYSYAGKNIKWESFKIIDLQDCENGFWAAARYDNKEGNPCMALIKSELNTEGRYIMRSIAENSCKTNQGFGVGLAIDGEKPILLGTVYDNQTGSTPKMRTDKINNVKITMEDNKNYDYKPKRNDGFLIVLKNDRISSVNLTAGKEEIIFKKQDIPVNKLVDPRKINPPAQSQ